MVESETPLSCDICGKIVGGYTPTPGVEIGRIISVRCDDHFGGIVAKLRIFHPEDEPYCTNRKYMNTGYLSPTKQCGGCTHERHDVFIGDGTGTIITGWYCGFSPGLMNDGG